MRTMGTMMRAALRATTSLQFVAVAAGAMTIAAPAAAQDYTRGNLVGTVVDQAGAPVSGATVTVRSNEQGFTNTATTDNNGQFRVAALPTGTYSVTVASGGATIVSDPSASVVAGQASTYRYTAGAAAEGSAEAGADGEIVVTGTRQRVDDFARSQIGATLDVAQLAQTVPIARNQTALILLAPGTTAGDTGFGNLASIGGATIAENAYYVNGLNITDFRTFVGGSNIPFEFYRSIDVKTGGYPAEYGRALGGVTSSVTKSGSNNFEAGLVAVYSPDALRSDVPDTVLARNGLDYSESVEANFYLSGPIIKDRLFFYGLYSPRYSKGGDSSISAGQRVTDRTSSPFFGGKVDAVITEGQRLEFTYFRDKRTLRRDFLEFDPSDDSYGAPLGTTIFKNGGDNFIGTYTGQFTDWLTVSAAYGENRNSATSAPSPNQSFTTSAINSDVGFRRVNGFAAGQEGDQDLRKIYRADADVYVNLFGRHHFRAGFDLEQLSAEENTLRTGSGYNYELFAPSAAAPNGFIRRIFYQNAGGFQSEQRAFYLQDSWTLFNDRLNLNLGVRNDRFSNDSVIGEEYYNSGDQWAPRLGASFDVFGDQRTRVSAFFGRYYLPVATNTNIRLGGAELFYRQQFNFAPGISGTVDANRDGIPDGLTFGADGAPTLGTRFGGGNPCPEISQDAGSICSTILSDGVAGATDTLISQNLAPSYNDEIIVGVSHRIGDFTFGLNYINRRLGETLEDVAIDAGVLAYCDANGVSGCEDVFTGFHQYVLSNPGSDITVRLDGDCSIDGQCDVVTLNAADLGYQRAVRKFDSVQFTFEKAFTGSYALQGSYSYTRLRGNYEGAVKSDINQTDAGLTQDFDQPGFQDGFNGVLANGREHVFKLFGYVEPTDWLGVGANILVESPRKFSCIGNYFDAANFAAAYDAASFYCVQPDAGGTPVENSAGGTSYLVPRGTAFQSDWNKAIDVSLTFKLNALSDSFGSTQLKFDVFNVLNTKSELDFDEFGDLDGVYEANPTYGQVLGYQAPRRVQVTLAMRFGGNN